MAHVSIPCPLCRREAEELARGDGMKLACRRCGKYRITGTAISLVAQAAADTRAYLAAYIRQANEAGEEAPLIDSDNWRQFADAHAQTSVAAKIQKVLEYVAKHTCIGEPFYFEESELAPIADVTSDEELQFLLAHLRDSHLAEYGAFPPPTNSRSDGAPSPGLATAIRLTVDGWNAAAPVTSGVPGTVFVAMSFAPELLDAYNNGILPALETDCGFRAVRVDRVHHNDNITDRIIAGIRSAQFVVADFTYQRQGVYYEAGFAQGLGRPVIRTCRATDFPDLHFDTRQFFHLKWSSAAELRRILADHVLATIGSGPAKSRLS